MENGTLLYKPDIAGYQNLTLIGEGGYGMVYEARQESTGQRVAIKLLKLDEGGDDRRRNYQIARFERETRLCAELNHPHIVRLLDKGSTEDGRPFAVFEYIEGETLKDMVVRKSGLSAFETGELMGQVLDALASAHARGIVHRDLKPHNIMVQQTGSQLHVKVLDFGIGAFTRDFRGNDYQSLTLTREVMGTPAYSAPEQLRGEPPTVKSDLYAWGLVLIECLTGVPVMQDGSMAEVFRLQLNSENVPLPPAIAGHSLAELLRRVLHKNARLRAGDAGNLYQDFRMINFGTLVGQIATNAPAPAGSTPVATAANPLGWQDIQSERRQITVLTIKLYLIPVGEVELDLETIDTIQQDQERKIADTAIRFGGHLANSFGGTLTAYFGYPSITDNDARRAGRAALEILSEVRNRGALLRQQHGLDIQVSAAIHSGQVLHRPNHLPEGGVPNRAFAMLFHAPANSILASGEAKALLDPYLEFETTSKLDLPGHSGLDRSHLITGERQTEALSFLRPWSANRDMVGRGPEKDHLLSQWELVRKGTGQAVIVHGQAGIGKSKMVYELKKQVRSDGFLFREVRCLSEYQNNALFPFLAMLQNHWGIAGLQDSAEVFSVLEAKMKAAGADLEKGLPVLCFWLSVPLAEGYEMPQVTPDVQKQLLFALLHRSIVHIGRAQPLMLVIEDLHWLDPTGREFVEFLLQDIAAKPYLLLMTTRPAWVPDWAQAGLRFVELQPLDADFTRVLIEHVLEGKGIVDQALGYIDERADGVPLYIEELTRMLVEEGYLVEREAQYQFDEATDIQAIPATLQDLLNARLDRLGLAKESAQIAATIGREFDYDLLVGASLRNEASVQSDLEALMDADLVYRQRKVNGDAYIFRHALIRDAAYDGMLNAPKREHHLRIAGTLKEGFAERVEENPFEVARHLAGGGSYAEGSEFGIRAVEKQVGNSANEEAIDLGTTLKGWIAEISEEKKRLELELSLEEEVRPAHVARFGFGSEFVRTNSKRTVEIVEKLKEMYSEEELVSTEANRQKVEKMAKWGEYNSHYNSGDLIRAREIAHEILDLMAESKDVEFELGTKWLFAQGRLMHGDLPGADQLFSEIMAAYDKQYDMSVAIEFGWDPFSNCLSQWSALKLFQGYPDTALAYIERAYEFSQSLGHFPSFRNSNLYQGVIPYILRDKEDTARRMQRFLDSDPDMEEGYLLNYHRMFLGFGIDDIQMIERAQHNMVEAGQDYGLSWYEPMRVEFYLEDAERRFSVAENEEHRAQAKAKLDQAVNLIEARIAKCVEREDIIYLPSLQILLARCYQARYFSEEDRSQDWLAKVETAFAEASAGSKKMGTVWWDLEVAVFKGHYLQKRGRLNEVEAELTGAMQVLVEGKSTLMYQEGRRLLSQLAVEPSIDV
ncbi:MAG: TOMM system kinase/cyclase fusion protein [Bacteroidota bacterium]